VKRRENFLSYKLRRRILQAIKQICAEELLAQGYTRADLERMEWEATRRKPKRRSVFSINSSLP
jgi:hypothetical protein